MQFDIIVIASCWVGTVVVDPKIEYYYFAALTDVTTLDADTCIILQEF